jgi:5-carboxymethyl-2-hydroxymuconate isomerase
MPHFVVDCSRDLLLIHDETAIITRLHRVVFASGLFEEADIKVRIKAIVSELAEMFPRLRRIAVNIAEFEKATYCNRAML